MTRRAMTLLLTVFLLLGPGCAAQASTAQTPVDCPQTQAADANQVLIILAENPRNMESGLKEVGVMVDMLRNACYQPVVATTSGKSLSGGFLPGSASLTPDLRLADVKVDGYKGVLVPCMTDDTSWGLKQLTEGVELVKKAAAQGKPVAAQHSGIGALVEAQLFTSTTVPEGVVQNGKVFTSAVCPYEAQATMGKKDGTVELMQNFIAVLGSTR